MKSVSFTIDAPSHRRRCRAVLELLQAPGPRLPFERPRIVREANGATRVLTPGGFYVGID